MAQDAAYFREYYHRTRERRRELAKELYRNNDGYRERQKAAATVWIANHPEAAREAAKRWQRNNLAAIREWAARDRAARPEHYKQCYHTRKDRENSTRAGRVSWKRIMARCGWTCGICGLPIDQETAFPDPMSLSFDHIIPLSRGGEHIEDNIQCAHLTCNKHKSSNIL